jgi:hypothetical protein
MTVFDDVFNILLPDHLPHTLLEHADRFKTQHFGILRLALCTLGLYAHVGQAGVGAIHQTEVSCHCPVPQDAVIAQPQMLFLVLDQHLNRPAFEIAGHNGLHRSGSIAGNQSDTVFFSSATRKNNFDRTEALHKANSFGQTVRLGFSQPSDGVPSSVVTQDISAVRPELMFGRADREPPVGLADADVMPPSCLTGLNHSRAQVVGIKQDGNSKRRRQRGGPYGFGGHLGELSKGQLQPPGLLAFDIDARGPGDGHPAIVQTDLQEGMAGPVFTGGVVEQGTDGRHFLGPLERLGLVDDQKQVPVFSGQQAAQKVQGDLLHDPRFVPEASPEEFAVIGSVGRASQRFAEAVNRGPVTDGEGHNQRPKMMSRRLGELRADGLEKTLEFFGNRADSNHKASQTISFCCYITYRPSRPVLFDLFIYHDSPNRSV